MLGGPVRSAGSDRVRGFPRILLGKFVVGRAVRFPPRPAAWTGVERLISECGEETVVSECGARCFSGGQARKTCPPEYRRPGEGVRPDSIFSLPVGFPFRRLLWAWVESSSLHGKRQPDPCPCRSAGGAAARRRGVFCCRIEVRQRRRGRSVGNRNLGLRVLSGKNPTALPERTCKRQKAGVRARRFGSASRTERSLYSVSATTRTIARASVCSS